MEVFLSFFFGVLISVGAYKCSGLFSEFDGILICTYTVLVLKKEMSLI